MLYTKLVQLEQQIQVHCIYPHNPTDEVQLEAPAYYPDIDGNFKQQEKATNSKEKHSPFSIHTENPVQQSPNRIEDTASSF